MWRTKELLVLKSLDEVIFINKKTKYLRAIVSQIKLIYSSLIRYFTSAYSAPFNIHLYVFRFTWYEHYRYQNSENSSTQIMNEKFVRTWPQATLSSKAIISFWLNFCNIFILNVIERTPNDDHRLVTGLQLRYNFFHSKFFNQNTRIRCILNLSKENLKEKESFSFSFR